MSYALSLLGKLAAIAGLLILAALLWPKVALMPASQQWLVNSVPLAIMLAAALLSIRFNRSRIFFSLLALAVAYITLIQTPIAGGDTHAKMAFDAIAFLLPVDILIFSFLRERGMFTLWGGIWFVLLFLQWAIVSWLIHIHQPVVARLFDFSIFDIDLHRWTPLTQPALLAVLLAVIVLNDRLILRPGIELAALLGAIFAVSIGQHIHVQAAFSVFFAIAAIMLLLAVIQETWHMAYMDELTGLPGRRALQENMLKLSGRYSIAMLDVDRFKKFNDTYGHDVGDQVLRMVASHMMRVGGGGKSFRYGGEEFCVLFPGKTVEECRENLEQLRLAVADHHFDLRNYERRKVDADRTGRPKGVKSVKITISIGVAEKTAELSDPPTVRKAADRALYRAKRAGRNRTREFTD